MGVGRRPLRRGRGGARGGGTFVDVTESAALTGDPGWPTSATFADLDGDGDLDLCVCHDVAWDAARPRLCRNPFVRGRRHERSLRPDRGR